MCVAAAVREPCIEAGLVKVLVPYLNSTDPEMLLNTGRAIGRICFDNGESVRILLAQSVGFTDDEEHADEAQTVLLKLTKTDRQQVSLHL